MAATTKINHDDVIRSYCERKRTEGFNNETTEMTNLYKSRLKTQDRKYINGYKYLPRVFMRLDVHFNRTIEIQLAKIYTFIKLPDNAIPTKINVNELSRTKFEKGRLYGKYNKEYYELLFNVNDRYYPFYGFVEKINDIALGHTKAMCNIINDNKDSLVQIKVISDLIDDTTFSNIRYKETLDSVIEKISSKNTDMSALSQEIALIESEVEFELIPQSVNLTIGKN